MSLSPDFPLEERLSNNVIYENSSQYICTIEYSIVSKKKETFLHEYIWKASETHHDKSKLQKSAYIMHLCEKIYIHACKGMQIFIYKYTNIYVCISPER